MSVAGGDRSSDLQAQFEMRAEIVAEQVAVGIQG